MRTSGSIFCRSCLWTWTDRTFLLARVDRDCCFRRVAVDAVEAQRVKRRRSQMEVDSAFGSVFWNLPCCVEAECSIQLDIHHAFESTDHMQCPARLEVHRIQDCVARFPPKDVAMCLTIKTRMPCLTTSSLALCLVHRVCGLLNLNYLVCIA